MPVCVGCEGEFDGEALQELRTAPLCGECLARLLRRASRPERRHDPRAGTGSWAARGADGAPRPRDPDVPCFVCGESLEGRSFMELRGFPVCADCTRELRRDAPGGPDAPAPGARERRAARASAGAVAAPAEVPCESCGRPADELRASRGFRLCLACMESAPELALALAQARHRRRLEREGRRLADEEEGG